VKESAESVNTLPSRRIVLLEEKAMMDVPGLISVRTAEFDSLKPARDRVHQTPDELLRSVWDDAAGELARTVRALGLTPDRADDVLQDVYLTALKKSPDTDDPDELRRWLFRVAINRCNLEHRRRARWRAVFETLAGRWRRLRRPERPPGNLDREEEREIVRAALDLLEPELRSVLVLRYYSGFNSREIGRILKVSDSTVRGRLRTARRRLAGELKRLGLGDD
jgi:RNA polymerase sigma-70 factor (ECF subfamily)